MVQVAADGPSWPQVSFLPLATKPAAKQPGKLAPKASCTAGDKTGREEFLLLLNSVEARARCSLAANTSRRDFGLKASLSVSVTQCGCSGSS